MAGTRMVRLGAAAAVLLAGCAYGATAASNTRTPLDEVCNPQNGMLPEPTDTFTAGWATFAVVKGWASNTSSSPRLELRRLGSRLTVSEGEPGPVPLEPPLRNANRRCELSRKDTSVVITASRGRGTDFYVQAWWETEGDGPILQLLLVTNSTEELKRIRGTIESVRFPLDSLRTRRQATK
ncbi:MAG: hypothetical protein U5K74_15150 [Gemmatimonadaceae bacterium]|nr:hypothetical protein [Gemmatimonadaceae bacterium]